MSANLSDIGQLAVSLATALGTTAGGVAWIWNKIEARFAQQKAEYEKAMAKIQEDPTVARRAKSDRCSGTASSPRP
jgi:uncharacterized protein YdgA (DUF945 family)